MNQEEMLLTQEEKDLFSDGIRSLEKLHKMIVFSFEQDYWKDDYQGEPLENIKLTSVGQIARDYGFSEEEFFKLLVELDIYKVVTNDYCVNVDYVTEGYTKSTLVKYNDSEGLPQLTLDTKWTPKGYRFLQDLLKKHGKFKLTKNEN